MEIIEQMKIEDIGEIKLISIKDYFRVDLIILGEKTIQNFKEKNKAQKVYNDLLPHLIDD